jgi:hypothetical protein
VQKYEKERELNNEWVRRKYGKGDLSTGNLESRRDKLLCIQAGGGDLKC